MAKMQMILIHAQRKLNFFSAKQLWNIKAHARGGSRNFCQGGSRPDGQNTALTMFFLVLKLILQFTDGVQWFYYREKTILFQGSRGGPTFSRGWGVQMLISIETHRTCDFSRGLGPHPGDPISPPSGSTHDI